MKLVWRTNLRLWAWDYCTYSNIPIKTDHWLLIGPLNINWKTKR